MGWDTYLHIGKYHDNWRKHAPSILALLFTAEEFSHQEAPPVDDEEEEGALRACFESSVKVCRARLNHLGFNWHFVTNICEEYRTGGISTGALLALLETGKVEESAKKKIYDEYSSLSAEQDMRAFVTYVRDLIRDKEEVWASDLPGGREEDHPYMFSDFGDMFPDREEMLSGIVNIGRYSAIRAGEFLDSLRYMTPDLGWIIFTRTILEALDDDEKVFLDISDYAYEILSFEENGLDIAGFGKHFIQTSYSSLSDHSKLMGRMYSLLTKLESNFGKSYFIGRALGLLSLTEAPETTAQERGRYLEDLVEALVRMESKLRVIQKNLANDTEELDLVLSNHLDNPFWISMHSPIIFVECKNWKSPVGASEARVFESKIRERGGICRVGIFVALNGYTAPFTEIVKRIQSQGHIIFTLTGKDIRDMLDKGMSLPEWLIEYGAIKII